MPVALFAAQGGVTLMNVLVGKHLTYRRVS
jgi:hypothetical protein